MPESQLNQKGLKYLSLVKGSIGKSISAKSIEHAIFKFAFIDESLWRKVSPLSLGNSIN